MGKVVPELSRQDALELVEEQRKEYRLVMQQRQIPGLILFEYDLTTGELRRPSMKKELQLCEDGSLGVKSRVDSNDFCLYVQAINEQNALRKVKQMLRRKSTRDQLFKQRRNGQ